MKILLTAFEPFGGLNTNSSLEVFKRIEDKNIIKIKLPVSYKRSREILSNAIDEIKPDFILSLGQAGKEDKIRIEKFGLNYQRASIPDNDGIIKEKGKIDSKLPLAYESCLNVEELSEVINNFVPSYVSLSAGGFICNTVYFTGLEKMHGKALFVHLPYYKGQDENLNPSMELSIMTETIKKILDFIYVN